MSTDEVYEFIRHLFLKSGIILNSEKAPEDGH